MITSNLYVYQRLIIFVKKKLTFTATPFYDAIE